MSYGTGYTLLNTSSNSYERGFISQNFNQLATDFGSTGGNYMTLGGQTFLTPGVWFVDVDIKAAGLTILQGGGGGGSINVYLTPFNFGVTASSNSSLISGLSASGGNTGMLGLNGRNLQNALDGYLNVSSIFRTNNQGNTLYNYISGGLVTSGSTAITQLKCVRIG
jgi:hypothetical protein